MTEGELLRLQRQVGNSAVAGLLASATTSGAPPPRDPGARAPVVARQPILATADHSAPRAITAVPPPRPDLVVQRHSSWEHRLLGDVDPDTLQVITDENEFAGRPWLSRVIATATGQRVGNRRADASHALQQQLENLAAWQASPPPPGTTTWRGVRLVTINLDDGSQVVCSVGEMNTLADYYGNIRQMKADRRETLQRILQTVRRQSWERLSGVLERLDEEAAQLLTAPRFEGAVATSGKRSDVELQVLTANRRNRRSETYLGNVSRNACHFAPQSWYRWKEHHEQGRELAQKAWRAKQQADRLDNDDLRRVASDLANEAVLTNGFGDHYLQDSFAAGHLINKTMIMQWFVQWMDSPQDRMDRWLGTRNGSLYLREWARVRRMSTIQQPDLAGTHLYSKPRGGRATDPQSAEEEPTRAARIARLGLRGPDRERAYQDYLQFLNNTAIQQASGNLHDHFCREGLEVYAGSTRVGQIYGDDNMIKGGDGVRFSAETAQKSQKAIEDVLAGREPEPVDAIMERLPDRVKLPGDGRVVSLEEWHTGGALRTFCETTIFPEVNYRSLGRVPFPPFAGEVSRDVPGGGAAASPVPDIDPRMLGTGPTVPLGPLLGTRRVTIPDIQQAVTRARQLVGQVESGLGGIGTGLGRGAGASQMPDAGEGERHEGPF